MASSAQDSDDPNNDPSGMNEDGSDVSPVSNIVIPETPSPSMPKRRPHQPNKDVSFDIAGSIFPDLSSHKVTTNKKKLEKSLHSTASATHHMEPGSSHRTTKSATSSSKVKLSSEVVANPASSSASSLKNHHVTSSDKHEASKKMSSSSSGSDEDIPLFKRIQKKRKIDKKNGSVFGSSKTKNSMNLSNEHIEPPGRVPKQSSNKMMRNAPDSKRMKFMSQSLSHKEVNPKTSTEKVAVTGYPPPTKVQSTTTSKSALLTGNSGDSQSQGTIDMNGAISKHNSSVKLRTSHSTNSQSSSLRLNAEKPGTSQSRVYESDPGHATSKGSKTKRKSPGNTVRNSKNSVIHRRIKDLFGSDTESEGDIQETESSRSSQQLSQNHTSSLNGPSVKKKDKSALRKTASSNDTNTEQQSNPHSSVQNKLQGHGNRGKEASGRGIPQSSSVGTNNCKNKKKRSNLILSDDSTDTEPEISLLSTKSKGRKKCNSPKRAVRHVGNTRNSSNSDDSDVEMMSAKGSPEKSPVFNRSTTPIYRRLSEERSRGERNSSHSNISSFRVSRTPKASSRSRNAEDHESDDSDVVPLENEVEVVPHGVSSRRSRESLLGYSGTGISHGLNRRVGAISELGTPIDLDDIMRVSSSSDLSQPGPSCRFERRPRRRSNQGAGNDEGRSRTTSSNSSAETRQRQLEADEQLARDLASGRISTPRSGRKIKKRGSASSARRNRQMAEDEALARELASGAIRTPVGEGATQQNDQIDDDEALARQLQEQFNAEAREGAQEADSDETDNTSNTLAINIGGQHPFTFHYEMGISPFPRPYPTFNPAFSISEMEPVILGRPPDSPPRTRSRRGRGRGRGRGGRGRRGNSSSVHIQFFPMDASLDDDYESLWELADRVGPAVQQGLAPEVLSLLPTFTYKASESAGGEGEENQGKNCTICMMDYEEGDNLRRLPCFHDYHTNCIDRWLTENCACPVCQTRVTLDEPIIE